MRRSLGCYLTIGCGCLLLYLSAQLFFMEEARRSVKNERTRTETFPNRTAANTKPRTSTPTNFIYLKEPLLHKHSAGSGKCIAKHEVRWRMAIFVKSSAINFFRRELFRRTWASFSYVDGLEFQTIFIIGNSKVNKPALVDEEFKRYGDLLQYAGPDDYRNVALKTLAGMNWAASNLPPDTFYSSMDDDVWVDLAALVKALKTFNDTMLTNDWPEYPIVCMYKEAFKIHLSPDRRNESKYFVPKSEYIWTKWPYFCLGGMYTLSGKVMRKLREISKQCKLVRMDDAWITGILREKLGMPLEMVVKPNFTVATHWKGFKKQKSKNIRDFMSVEWKKLKESFNSSSLCP